MGKYQTATKVSLVLRATWCWTRVPGDNVNKFYLQLDSELLLL